MMKKLLPACALTLLSGLAAAQYPAPPAQYAAPSAAVMSTPKFTVPVVSATPVYQTEVRERRVCDQVAPSSEPSVAGTIVGGLAGGLLGNQIGKGTGRTVATAAGAVGGALVGNAVANNGKTQPACRMVAEQQQVIAGYDVVYDFSGQRGQVRMSQPPGQTIVVEVRPAN